MQTIFDAERQSRKDAARQAANEEREAFGVRGIPALSKAAEFAALQTLRDAGNGIQIFAAQILRSLRAISAIAVQGFAG